MLVITCWNYVVDCGASSQLSVRSLQACGEKTSLQLLDADEEGSTFVLNFGDSIPGDTVSNGYITLCNKNQQNAHFSVMF